MAEFPAIFCHPAANPATYLFFIINGIYYFSLDESHSEEGVGKSKRLHQRMSLDGARKDRNENQLKRCEQQVQKRRGMLPPSSSCVTIKASTPAAICSAIKNRKVKLREKTASCSRSVPVLSQLLTNMFPRGTSGVLLPITAWLEWKKAFLFCQGLLNQDDLNLWGHTAGTSGGDWKVING